MTTPLDSAVELLKALITAPSPSRGEDVTAAILEQWLGDSGLNPRRAGNNVWAVAPGFDSGRLTLMLNSHHDTVRPASGYTRDPYSPVVEGGRLYGLGSNDAGASVVALAQTFRDLASTPLPYNLVLALSAEEEVTGAGGMRALLPAMAEAGVVPDMAIVGEPTGMQPAVGERGLVVLDCTATGVSGHAARGEGINALYKALDDIAAIRALTLPKVSPALGPVGMTVTQIAAGTQHNVVPDRCTFTIDVRTTDAYSNEETVELIRRAITSEAVPRSTHLRASVIDTAHPLVRACVSLGLTPFVSPTMSDMAVMHSFPSLKIGPGLSARSHTADEFVEIAEIAGAISLYPKILTSL